ncbi:MAG: hypothetical protein ACOYEV_08125 [Candidatus Nanopelagicales bacterium]
MSDQVIFEARTGTIVQASAAHRFHVLDQGGEDVTGEHEVDLATAFRMLNSLAHSRPLSR